VRRIALILATLAAAGAAVATTSASGDDSRTYYIELDNAFGLVKGSEVKVAGVSAGQITDLFINSQKRAVVKVELSGPVAVLGEDTVCSSEPQSLIAEYFIDCTPKGPPIDTADESDEDHAEDPDIPVEQTRQTVQNDLVLSTMRMPFRARLTLLINSFGTALAGNSENLNSAIRRGAPALEQTQQVFHLLAQQNTIIRDLNADSDEIIGKLAERRQDVTRFIQETRDTAEASAARRDDLSQNFALLDDFLAELKPTMTELNTVAVQGTPLAANLRRAAPGLTTLSRNLPNFNPAATDAVVSLGKSSVVGQRALRKGRDEVRALRDAARDSEPVAENLADFLLDIDDPKRAVEVDARAARDTNRKAPTGYTGMEGLLNYLYYQTLAINQYDEIGHFLHFTIMEVGTGPCANYNAGPTVPSSSGGETTSLADANRCVAWLGPNQPGINQSVDVPAYDPSVCPGGSDDLSLCNPAGTTSASDGFKRAHNGKAGTDSATAGTSPGTDGSSTGDGPAGTGTTTPTGPDGGTTTPTAPGTPTTPGSPTAPAPGTGNGGKNGALGLGILGLRGAKSGQGAAAANEDLLGYLFGS
jgi:ABC-type transporter Mla subunit MlaD